MQSHTYIRLLITGTVLFCWIALLQAQPYAPAAGLEGSDALHADDPLFRAWAVSCLLERGPGIIGFPDSVVVNNGEAGFATGKAGNEVVSLGDGGRATMLFDYILVDGPGPDFAVFENSFDGNFLELGFVEVSSDAEHFVRFPSSSLTPVDVQLGPFSNLDPEKIHNLAGKYKSGWGVPFDLAQLKDSAGLNLMAVMAVRVIDVIGILDENLGSRDAAGRLINDPFPTPFETGGFDLDAVGLINLSLANADKHTSESTLKIYPNPCMQELFFEFPEGHAGHWQLLDMTGRTLMQGQVYEGSRQIGLDGLQDGTYILQGSVAGKSFVKKIIKDSR